MKKLIQRIYNLFKPDPASGVLFIIIFFIPASFYTSYLYGLPWKKAYIDINDTSKSEYSISPKISDEFVKNFLGRIFQTSLSLDWYDICLINKNKISINNEQAKTKDLLKSDPEAGAMELIITDLNEPKTTSSLYTKLDKPKECTTLSLDTKPTIKLVELTRRRPEKFNATVKVSTDSETVKIEMVFDSKESYAYIKNNFWAWALKFLAIFGLWAAFILFIKKLLEFVKDSNVPMVESAENSDENPGEKQKETPESSDLTEP